MYAWGQHNEFPTYLNVHVTANSLAITALGYFLKQVELGTETGLQSLSPAKTERRF